MNDLWFALFSCLIAVLWLAGTIWEAVYEYRYRRWLQNLAAENRPLPAAARRWRNDPNRLEETAKRRQETGESGRAPFTGA
jgi:hypothetical protein